MRNGLWDFAASHQQSRQIIVSFKILGIFLQVVLCHSFRDQNARVIFSLLAWLWQDL